jgi:predicted permease
MSFLTQLRDGVRSFTRQRTLTLLAAGLLAVGVGSATTVFIIVNALWLRPLPMRDADALVTIAVDNVARHVSGGPFSWAAYQAIAASRAPALASITAVASDRFTLTGAGDPEQLAGARVSASFFAVLDVPLAAGRGFLPEEDQPGGPSAVVLGRRLWMRRFGGDRAIVGRTLLLNGSPFLVVGALGVELPPPLSDVDAWTTKVWEIGSLTAAQVASGAGYLSAIGRLAPGASVATAQAVIDGARRTYAAANPGNTDADPGATLHMEPFDRQMVRGVAAPLRALSGAVALVVLIASANVAGLLLVRGNAREREWMIRVALGAGRSEVLRQLAIEALLLAGTAAAGSLLLAWWTLRIAQGAISTLPRGTEASLDGTAVAFAGAAAILAALAASGPAAWRAMRAGTSLVLRSDSRTVTRRGTGGALVAGEVTLAVVLLIAALLLVRSLVNLTHVPLGYDPAGVMTMRITLPAGRYPQPPQLAAAASRLVERVRGVPGVETASIAVNIPPNGSLYGPYQDAGEAPKPVGERALAAWSCITPEYFSTMRIPVVRGRAFSERDTLATPRVTILSRALAERLWPGQDPIGRRVFVARLPEPSEVVGVVGDVRNDGLERPPFDQMYSPYRQRTWSSLVVVIRSASSDPLRLQPALRAALRDVDPDLAPSDMQTADEALGDAASQRRLTAALMSGFGLMACAMAAVGLYGVVSYRVAQGVRDIGIRVALGASRRGVLALVVGQALRVSAAGIGLGVAAALVLTQLFQSLLYDVRAADPATYVAVSVVFLLVSVAASALPARRAIRINPVDALKEQ